MGKLNPKNLLIKILLTLIVLSPAPIYFAITYADLTDDPDYKNPWVSFFNDPYERVYITWETEEPAVGYVQYGTSPSELNIETAPEPVARGIHHIIINSLESNTTYYYRAVWEGGSSPIRTFRTAPAPSENLKASYKFVMFSDTQQPKIVQGHHHRIADIIAERDYRFAAVIGDLVDNGYKKYLWNNFFAAADPYLESTAFVPVLGNHDRFFHNTSVTYFPFYFINNINTTGRENGQFYWSFNYGPVHFTILSFVYALPSEFTQEQIDWLIDDLKSAQDMPFRIVMFHCPIIGSGFFRRSQTLLGMDPDVPINLTRILIDYNVSAVINGHEHHYERGNIQGMEYFILGGGGGALDPGLCPQPETQVMSAMPSFTEVTVTPEKLTFKTFGLNTEFLDEYVIENTKNLTANGGSD